MKLELKVPIKVQINMIDETIKALKRAKKSKLCPKNTSKDFKRGFAYCCVHLIRTLEYIKEKEWHTDEADAVEIKQGKWIYHPDDLFPAESTQECSICHEEESISLCNENYCPNCGAKMDRKGD